MTRRSERVLFDFTFVQTLLINGRGQFNCSMAAGLINTTLPQCKFRGNEQCAPEFLHVLPNKTYRIRIASTTALVALNLAIGVSISIIASHNYFSTVLSKCIIAWSGAKHIYEMRVSRARQGRDWLHSHGVLTLLSRSRRMLRGIFFF